MENRFKINFNFTDCTHIYFKDSSCNRCVEICPIENVITREDFKIMFNSENCVKCGACVGVCPTEAFKFDGFSLENFVNKFVEDGQNILSCKKDIPCLSFLHPEVLIVLALKKKEDIILDIGFCGECFIKDLLNGIKENVQEANYFLKKLGVENQIKLEEIRFQQNEKNTNTKDRRNFLKDLGKISAGLFIWSISPKIPVEEGEKKDIKNIVEEKINLERRKLLLETLKSEFNLEELEKKYVEVDKISFTSDKWIEEKKCTNCSICYSVCPTGALKDLDNKIKISFEPSLCIKCRVCHEVCPEECLHLKEELNLKEFVNNNSKILVEHIMIQCSECLIPFSYKGDTTVCPRCRELEDEIKELLKIE